MATVPAPPPVEIITMTYGPFVTGIMMQQLLMGVVVVQVYDYYRVFPKDTTFNKWLVGVLFATSVLQAVMDYKILYRCSVEFYGNFDKFDDTDWTFWWEIAVTAVIGSIAQSFFLERCWSATKSWTVVVIGLAGILLSLGSGIGSTIEFMRVGKLSRVPEIPAPITIWLVCTAVIDLAIAAVLIWSISRVKSRFRKTETIVARIIRLTFQTSAITAAIAIVNVILYLALPGEAFHLLPQLVMGKLYAISVLVTLSSRTELRNIMNATANATYVESRVETRRGGATSKIEFTQMGTLNQPGGVQINTTTYMEGDDGNPIHISEHNSSDTKFAPDDSSDIDIERAPHHHGSDAVAVPVPAVTVSGPFANGNKRTKGGRKGSGYDSAEESEEEKGGKGRGRHYSVSRVGAPV